MILFKKLFGAKDAGRGHRSASQSGWEHERGAAAKLMGFLEGRQVLYREVTEKCPRGVVRSARKIRSELRHRSAHLEAHSELAGLVNQMRETIREFLACTCKGSHHPKTCEDCAIASQGCARELLQFRRQMGRHIQALGAQFKMIPADCLKDILPAESGSAPACGICPTLLGPGSEEKKNT